MFFPSIGVRDDRTPGGLTKARFKRIRMLSEFDIPSYESEQSQSQLEGDIQLLVNCDPYISPSFVTTEGEFYNYCWNHYNIM